jgi:hypothetical protein
LRTRRQYGCLRSLSFWREATVSMRAAMSVRLQSTKKYEGRGE